MDLLRPLAIGSVRLPNNLVLSPMAGFSDLPFRVLCRRHGAGLVSSEMVGAHAVERGVPGTIKRMRVAEEERPSSIQVFGTDPGVVAAAARTVSRDCDIVGFNMGCPAHQIQAQGCGAALLDHPERCEEIVRAIKAATTKPLLVKMRAGNARAMDVVAFARRLETAGADAIIFHARTAAMGYSGKSDWSLIRDVKEAISIPLIGNGDVVDGPTARRALETGVDGLALGRATLGDPRIFRRVAQYLETGVERPRSTDEERLEDFLAYAKLAQEIGLGGAHVVQQAQQFTRGIRGATALRERFKGHMPAGEIARAFEAHLAVRSRA